MLLENQLKDNNFIYKKMNLLAWYEAGYYGAGIKVGTTERWDLNNYNLNNLCNDPYDTFVWLPDNPLSGGGMALTHHGESTARTLHQIAPKANIVMLPAYGYQPSRGVDDFRYYSVPYIKKHGITIMTNSLISDAEFNERTKDLLEDLSDSFTWFSCAGNDSTGEIYNPSMESEYVIGVGALRLNWGDDSRIRPEDYTSPHNSVDFSASGSITLQNLLGYTYEGDGTSFATPIIAGISAIVNEFFLKKTGKVLGFKQMYNFLKDCSYDVLSDGLDDKTGWGMPKLPNPEDVDISKYASNTPYTDWDSIASWAQEDVMSMYNLGIMMGDSNGNFNPNSPLTRQEAAVVMGRLYNNLIQKFN